MNRQIKANPELFQQWLNLGIKITALRDAVQNDMTVTKQQRDGWLTRAHGLRRDLSLLIHKTELHLRGGSGLNE